MEQEVLTFRDWQENFVISSYDLNLLEVRVTSFNKLIINEHNQEKVKEMLYNENKFLLKYYHNNFDSIQKQFQKLINESV